MIFLNFLTSTLIIVLGTFGIVFSLFTLVYILSGKKTDKEKGLTPIYTERCGGRFGFVQATFPFVRISLYENFLVIRSYGKLTIEYARIKELRDVGFLGMGLEIITTNSSKYGQPIIGTFNRSHIKNIILKCLAKSKNNITNKTRK